MLRRLARGMLLLQPASGTLEHRTQPWNDFLNFMGTDDQQNSLTPAETVAHPPAGSHGGLSVGGLDLFADLDLDTLLGSTATSSTEPPRATVAQLTSTAAPFGVPHHSIMSGVPAAWNAPMTHHAAAYTARQHPATLCAPTAFNIVISQNPAISVARPGKAPNLAPIASPSWPLTGGRPGDAQLPGHGGLTPLPMKVDNLPSGVSRIFLAVREERLEYAKGSYLTGCDMARHNIRIQSCPPISSHFMLAGKGLVRACRPPCASCILPAWEESKDFFPCLLLNRSLHVQEGSRMPSHPSSSTGSQASAKIPLRAHRQLAARRTRSPAPTERAQKEAAARARNARNQQLHRQRQKVSPARLRISLNDCSCSARAMASNCR